ncbi:hypothetical protein HCN44_003053 [Aphidius gifuensis]|uniref:Uncharacterized protein n=1 Tax=Aphidius gifuensis TaxID=684658 RepID=A0A834XJV6_APHGI|nr:uncharacterized protein CG13380 [Aphidius gifuensis]KAF7987291.1 hypothetical protein HCN44_003053 [Aphidius gifuensis]
MNFNNAKNNDENDISSLNWIKTSSSNECICARPKGYIYCNGCLHHTIGRVKTRCNVHKNVVYISDFERCPECKAWAFMMDEAKIKL